MRILRRENYRLTPWKNGGGETAGIAVFPEHAGLGDFDWRISMATVASDGPFSTFPGVDRTLSVLEGEGIVLEVEGLGSATLTPNSEPFSFAADSTAGAGLVGGTITDLNVMTRRGRFSHKVERREVDGTLYVASGSMVFAGSENLHVRAGGGEVLLGIFDMVLPQDDGVVIAGRGLVYLIEISRP